MALGVEITQATVGTLGKIPVDAFWMPQPTHPQGVAQPWR